MDKKYVQDLAQKLYNAYNTKESLDWKDFKDAKLTEKDAYDVQHAFNKLKGESVRAYKISLTSKETQDMFKSNTPLYGEEVESSVLKSGTTLQLAELMEPLLEVELQFVAKEDLSVNDDDERLLKKTEPAPGFEVPDSRFKDWFPKLPKELVVSDSAVAGRVVVGKTSKPLTLKDLEQVKVTVMFNGKELTSGYSSEVLGNPLNSVKWLVQKLDKEGRKVTKGTVVSTGTFVLPKRLQKGMYSADFDHGAGRVELFVK